MIEEGFFGLEESLHNATQQRNTFQEAVFGRTHIVGPELIAKKKDDAPQSKNHQRSKKHQSTPQNPEEDRCSHVPPLDQAENHSLKVQQKHSSCTGILKSKIPKFVEKSLRLGEHDEKGEPDEHV